VKKAVKNTVNYSRWLATHKSTFQNVSGKYQYYSWTWDIGHSVHFRVRVE